MNRIHIPSTQLNLFCTNLQSRSTAFQSFQLATDFLSAQEVVQVASKVLELSLNKERKRQ